MTASSFIRIAMFAWVETNAYNSPTSSIHTTHGHNVMNVRAYFTSLSDELNALKNRVRNFINDGHWPTDGEWKESVLRTILRRHLPATVEVARGFVISHIGCSKQLDILIYDTSKPVLYRDGDLVFVTADAVKGIIEVKSNADMALFSNAVQNLAENAQFIRSNQTSRQALFVGLFSYDTSLQPHRSTDILQRLSDKAQGDEQLVVNHICLGDALFIRFWRHRPRVRPIVRNYNQWHCYDMPGLSKGYFINNVVDSISSRSVRQNRSLWFPLDSKEVRKIDEIAL